MTLQEALDKYCLARSMRLRDEQIGYANLLVDEQIPELVERLACLMIERNAAVEKQTY